ncbi:MAG: ferrous iron transport protein A [Dehalococcoidia bacterium]|nr:ferrous iron transport protein A [Dehalococcoidia bacterium]
MPQKRQMTLAEMEPGQTGTVVEVLAGPGLVGRGGQGFILRRGPGFMRRRGPGFMRGHGPGFGRRLEALGVRPGKKVTKVGSTFFRGPVTLRAGNTQVAVGFGMANRIVVEVDAPT